MITAPAPVNSLRRPFFSTLATSPASRTRAYLARVTPATVKGIVDESSNRMGRLLFKMAVEQAVIENILAAVCEVDQQELKRLRGQCVEEIKRTNGMISFEQALQWQKE